MTVRGVDGGGELIEVGGDFVERHATREGADAVAEAAARHERQRHVQVAALLASRENRQDMRVWRSPGRLGLAQEARPQRATQSRLGDGAGIEDLDGDQIGGLANILR